MRSRWDVEVCELWSPKGERGRWRWKKQPGEEVEALAHKRVVLDATNVRYWPCPVPFGNPSFDREVRGSLSFPRTAAHNRKTSFLHCRKFLFFLSLLLCSVPNCTPFARRDPSMKACNRKRSREGSVARSSEAVKSVCRVSSAGDQRCVKNRSKSSAGRDNNPVKNRCTSAAESAQNGDKTQRNREITSENLLVVSAARKQQMKEAFQPWVIHTYGDAAKTKTISQRKADRIVRILRGEDSSNGADSSKFRFWVRAKGFRLGPLQSADQLTKEEPPNDQLYVITGTNKSESGEDIPVYKKVAVVEDFFDIIYREHVEFGGKTTAKHAGQKRTFRAITEIYAFLPREAVTRFLLQCAECQKRGNAGPPTGSSTETASAPHTPAGLFSLGSPTPPNSPKGSYGSPVVRATPPRESRKDQQKQRATKQKQQRCLVSGSAPCWDLRTADVDLSLPLTATLLKQAQINGVSQEKLLGLDRAEATFSCGAGQIEDRTITSDSGRFSSVYNQDVAMATTSFLPETAVLLPSTVKSETSKAENQEDSALSLIKDDEDEDEDDLDDKLDSQSVDPERLKAFNMFVRLFVNENLDRMVPISRQPREKIQAIIDSCSRQFPELGERARKRIRTYLKSCRRSKRSHEPSCGSTGIDGYASTKSVPPHLTSAAAERILNQACENENQNAKRVKLGLDPVSQPLPSLTVSEPTVSEKTATQRTSALESMADTNLANFFRPFQLPVNSFITPFDFSTNNNEGPTDLSIKSKQYPSNNKVLPHRLNPMEVVAIQQLAAGYRESAAFLLRSAEELEQLLRHQHSFL